jgi:hypothetical protein
VLAAVRVFQRRHERRLVVARLRKRHTRTACAPARVSEGARWVRVGECALANMAGSGRVARPAAMRRTTSITSNPDAMGSTSVRACAQPSLLSAGTRSTHRRRAWCWQTASP